MNSIKVSALFRDSEVGIERLLLLIPRQRHDAHVGMAQQALPDVVEAVFIVRLDETVRIVAVVHWEIVKALSEAILKISTMSKGSLREKLRRSRDLPDNAADGRPRARRHSLPRLRTDEPS
jgi:hypothetical protein